MVDFVEALQDAETSPLTVKSRAAALKKIGVIVPRNVSIIIYKKMAEELVQQGKLEDLMKFLDPGQVPSSQDTDLLSDSIANILPDPTDERHSELAREFQVGCLVHLINNLLLKEYQGNGNESAPEHLDSIEHG